MDKQFEDDSSDEDNYIDNAVLHSIDTREPNLDSSVYPYNCIGLLKWRIGLKKGFGTAFLISPSLILTAAHNLISGLGGEAHK